MLPELWTIPIINYQLKSFGFMLMLGFITAAYLAARRAQKVQANPDLVLNCAIVALVGSVIGARLFYVVHYWEREFVGHPNPIVHALNITSGGMEQLGGVAGALILILAYLLFSRVSIRLYLDILTPSFMWGLAFGRIGCFLNGCCFGGLTGGTVADHWAVEFPYGSPPYAWQYRERLVEVPAELLTPAPRAGVMIPLPREQVFLPPAKRGYYAHRLVAAQQRLEAVQKLGADPKAIEAAKRALDSATRLAEKERQDFQGLDRNLRTYMSARFPGQQITPSELQDLTVHPVHAVHPVQIYSAINAFLGSLFLAWLFRVRRRHGMVFVAWLLTYPITRIIEEQIRVDNPHDTLGLTISSAISVGMILLGLLLAALFSRLPLRSALAVPWIAPSDDPQPTPPPLDVPT